MDTFSWAHCRHDHIWPYNAVFFVRYQPKKQQVASRIDYLAAIAKENQYRVVGTLPSKIRSKNFMLITQEDDMITNCITTDDWMYGELSYDIRQQSKFGNYISETVYYSILQVPLSRKLPNMFLKGIEHTVNNFVG